jgi:polysaccharide biosynthesis/export protein
MIRTIRTLALAAAMLVGGAAALAAQAPSGDAIRAQIRQSGLTPDQIRQRLQAAGYSAGLLDAYLAGGNGPAPAPSQDVLNALSRLSPGMLRADGLREIPVDTGLVLRHMPDSLMADSLELAPADTALQVFGLEVFRGGTSQFQPLLAGPVPDTYRLGAGDMLVLVISGDVEIVHNLEVTRDGFILIPQVGQIYVATMTMNTLRSTLRTRLGNAYSGIRTGSTRFDVTISRLRTNQVYVVGEVVQPGAYQLASVATVLNALYAAGGPTERANLRTIRVQRGGQTVTSFDLYDYLLRGDVRGDQTLEMGDVVFVGVHGVRAALRGAVVRPAIYELAPGQTLRELVAAAGGFTPEAALRRISVSRILPPSARGAGGPDRIVLDIPVEQVVDGLAPPVVIEAGDEVEVFRVPESRRAMVTLDGAVYHPGTYGWRPGLRISELVRLAGGVRPAVYAEIAHIERLNVADSTRSLLRVPVPADSLTPWARDVELQDYDVVTLYAREELREAREVSIAGMVGEPGAFPYSEGMTVRDLILRAGGLRDGAFLDSVEIARLPRSRERGELATTFRMPLDSTYLFEPPGTSFRFLPGPGARAAGAAEIPLEPFDRVTVLRQPDFELQRMVKVEGEVRLPGTFALQHRDERLSSLVQRAGGLSPTAFVEGARLVREADSAGPVNIDLAAAMREPGGRHDLILRPGDLLEVPEYNAVVKVQGAVFAPMSVQYRPGAGLAYYIANAGGYSRDADKGRVSVRYANGSAEVTSRTLLLFRNRPEVRPGSVVTVPLKPDAEPFNVTGFLSAAAQILASTVAIIVVATR